MPCSNRSTGSTLWSGWAPRAEAPVAFGHVPALGGAPRCSRGGGGGVSRDPSFDPAAAGSLSRAAGRLPGMFNIGGGEFLVIALVALIVLGPQRLPDAARQAGRAMAELR